jgi:hypothetical protein
MDWINLALVNTVMYLWFHKMQGIWLTEKPDSEGLCSRQFTVSTGQLNCDSTRAETRFRFLVQRMSPFKLGRGGCQFSRLLAAEVCAALVVMLDTPCSEVV